MMLYRVVVFLSGKARYGFITDDVLRRIVCQPRDDVYLLLARWQINDTATALLGHACTKALSVKTGS
jgi:hypothetical protein